VSEVLVPYYSQGDAVREMAQLIVSLPYSEPELANGFNTRTEGVA